MKKVLKKKLTTLIVMCSMILTVVAFPVAVGAHTLTFDPNGGTIEDNNPYQCDTEDKNGKQYIKNNDAQKVFGAAKAGYELKYWRINNGQQTFNTADELLAFEFTNDTELKAEWEKTITLTFYSTKPTDETSSFDTEVSEGYAVTEEVIHRMYPDQNGYTLVGLEYAGKGGIAGNQYVYGTPITQDTDLKLLWKKVVVPGGDGGSANDTPSDNSDVPTRANPTGGGGSRGGGGGTSNPKTGDLGVAVYVGIMVVSALGTAGVVKLLKKEK